MGNNRIEREQVQQTIDAVAKHGTVLGAANALGLPRGTVKDRVAIAKRLGIKPSAGLVDAQNLKHMQAEVKRLMRELATAEKQALTESAIKRGIISLAQDVANSATPSWVLEASRDESKPGVPTLFLSDLHWGEKVQPSQINGVNKFNLDIAKERLKRTAKTASYLLSIISPKLDYPGIVIPLGGDMISGNIHDELTATNEINSMPALLDLHGELVGLISGMADTFGRVFLPCVTGNHGRDTHKIWSKDRHATSFDWLLYCFLAKHFENDKRVTFLIPDGPDAYFRIYGHRYLLTHGDQFRGGDGMIGALGPIIRGDHKKRSRNAQIDMAYDTMLIGHWHQYIHLTRLIVNGSLKGMDEYAYANNFPFEAPQQALWITHQKWGINWRMPVFCERQRSAPKTSWVSVSEMT